MKGQPKPQTRLFQKKSNRIPTPKDFFNPVYAQKLEEKRGHSVKEAAARRALEKA